MHEEIRKFWEGRGNIHTRQLDSLLYYFIPSIRNQRNVIAVTDTEKEITTYFMLDEEYRELSEHEMLKIVKLKVFL